MKGKRSLLSLAFTVLFPVLVVGQHVNLLIGSTSGDSSSSTFESHDDSGNLITQGTLDVPRSSHTATLLTTGNVFVAGGVQAPGSWEIYNSSGRLQSSGTLLNALYGHFAVRLGNGNVFLGGGVDAAGAFEIHSSTGALVSSGSLLGKRGAGVGAVLLQDGNVWISGSNSNSLGGGNPGDACTWEIHSPSGTLLSNGSLNTCFSSAKIFVLGNSDVLLMGGAIAPSTYEIRTQTGAFVRDGTLINGFDGYSGAAFLNNNVFLFEQGYWEYVGLDANAHVTFDTTGSLLDGRSGARAVVTSTNRFFITGGSIAPATWEMYTPSGTTVTLYSYGNLFDTREGGHTDTHF